MNQRQQFLLCHWKPTSRRVRGTFAFGPHSCIAALMLPFVGGIAARRAYLAECGRLTPRRYPLAKRSASRQGRLSPRVLEAISPSGQQRTSQLVRSTSASSPKTDTHMNKISGWLPLRKATRDCVPPHAVFIALRLRPASSENGNNLRCGWRLSRISP